MSALAIEAKNLVKRYRVAVKKPGFAGAVRHLFAPKWEEKLAVNGIDLSVKMGERVAYLGPNGAGKSTTIKILTGVLHPTAGEVRVCDLSPVKERIRHARNIGVVFGHRSQLFWDLPVIESFRLLGDIYGLSKATYEANLAHAIEGLDLGDLLEIPVRGLSLGQRVRCDIVAAFLHRPKVVFLDEPTIGLDIAVKERLRRFIRETLELSSTTLILTSHDLGDIEHLCERVVVIDQGKKLFEGTIGELESKLSKKRVLSVHLAETSDETSSRALAAVAAVSEASASVAEPGLVRIDFDPTKVSTGDLLTRVINAASVRDVRIEREGIQEVVRKVYQGALREGNDGNG